MPVTGNSQTISPTFSADNFKPHQAPDCLLSILWQAYGLSYCITHGKQVLALYQYEHSPGDEDAHYDFLHDVVKADERLALRFGGIRTIIQSRQATVVPKNFFEADKLETIAKLHFPLADSLHVASQSISSQAMELVYAYPQHLHSFIKDHFIKPEFTHRAALLLQHGHQAGDANSLLLHVERDLLSIAAYSKGQLQLFNTYEYRSAEDFIYFVMAVCEQLAFNPEKLELKLSGGISEDSQIYKLLYKYIRNIGFAEASSITRDDSLGNLPAHLHYPLYLSAL